MNALVNTNAQHAADTFPTVPAPMTALTPMAMLGQAVANGASIDVLAKLMDLSERWEANQARKAFDEAISAAKSEIKPILKRQKGHTGKYEDLADIAAEVDPILSKHGLSYRYRSKQDEKVHVTCVVSHKAGYSEETTLSAAPDAGPSRNAIQAIGSALTYLQRYSLKLALGLSATKDDDGRAAGLGAAITEDQIGELVAQIESVGANKAQFLKYFKIEALPELPAARYQEAVNMLNAKARAKA